MKKIVSLIVLACVFLLCLTSCGGSKYDRALRLIEKGKYEAAYELLEQLGDDEDAVKLRSRFYSVLVSYVGSSTEVREYTKDNLLSKSIVTHENGKIDTRVYTYDANGNLLKDHYIRDDKVAFIAEYAYDANNNVIHYTHTDADGKTEI
jgi:hypothetical protein